MPDVRERVAHEPSRAEELQALLAQNIADLAAGRISPAEAAQVTTAARREIAEVEIAMRAARLGSGRRA